jgi:2'-hydroxyisoflavone reductase
MVRPAHAEDAKAPEKLDILVLGGTGQTGPHFIRAALDHGHNVTMFNRGHRSAELFPDVECLIGDRNEPDGLKAIEEEIAKGRRWDVVIDIWPSHPKLVDASASLLKDAADRYMFVSSISVYADHSVPHSDETAEVQKAPENWRDLEFSMELYGAFKAECENRVRLYFPEHNTIFRPGLIVGPRDFSFRGGYWPVRVRSGGEVMAPGDPSDPIQIVDGRDLAAFELLCMEKNINGTFDVTGPKEPLTIGAYLEACKKATGSDATFTWVPAEFLETHEVSAWMNMPTWVPPEGEYAGFGNRNVNKAIAAGLVFRPLTETITDTLTWYDGLDEKARAGVTSRAGMPAEREAEVLAAWHEQEKES